MTLGVHAGWIPSHPLVPTLQMAQLRTSTFPVSWLGDTLFKSSLCCPVPTLPQNLSVEGPRSCVNQALNTAQWPNDKCDHLHSGSLLHQKDVASTEVPEAEAAAQYSVCSILYLSTHHKLWFSVLHKYLSLPVFFELPFRNKTQQNYSVADLHSGVSL